MRRIQFLITAMLISAAWCLAGLAATATDTLPVVSAPVTVEQAYPGLASSVLKYARLAELPEGIFLKSGDITISEKELADVVANEPENLREQLDENAFFVLEHIAAPKILLAAARQEAARANRDVSKSADGDVVKEYLKGILDAVQVGDEEVAAFYEDNKSTFGDAKLDAVKTLIAQYLREQKQQETFGALIKSFGQKMTIEVSAAWVKTQSVLSRDNPVDKARLSGKPSLVDFGSKGCGPCDMLAPILETLREKYEGKMNVLFISVVEEEILAARYGIDTIPTQIFFDKDGKEVFRHIGFFSQEAIEKKLAEMGAK